MTLTYKNREGKTYYQHLGKIKTGKDKNFCSRKAVCVLFGLKSHPSAAVSPQRPKPL